MSMYGPPGGSGGPYPGQPQDPWQGGQQGGGYGGSPYGGQPGGDPYGGTPPGGDPYGQPAPPPSPDPYGQPSAPPYGPASAPPDPYSAPPAGGDPWGHQPMSAPPTSGQPWGAPTPPPQSGGSNTAIILVLVIVLGLLVLGGGGFGLWLVLRDDGSPSAQSTQTTAPVDSPSDDEPTDDEPTDDEPTDDEPTDDDEPTTDPKHISNAKPGDCVKRNDSPEKLEITDSCGSGTYTVKRRYDGTTNYVGRCTSEEVWYWLDVPGGTSEDFVLCLKQN